jgi:hypothetical protein
MRVDPKLEQKMKTEISEQRRPRGSESLPGQPSAYPSLEPVEEVGAVCLRAPATAAT